VLHGAKVGLGVINACERYDRLRGMSAKGAAALLGARRLPTRASQVKLIRRAYGTLADYVIDVSAPFLDMSAKEFSALKARVLEDWDGVQRIAATVPPAEQVRGWLETVGGPVTGAQIGLGEDEVALAVATAHYFRLRFTVGKLFWVLGLL
jgi:glycerol dehydrogenase-like iron-containing ADH family enzyme